MTKDSGMKIREPTYSAEEKERIPDYVCTVFMSKTRDSCFKKDQPFYNIPLVSSGLSQRCFRVQRSRASFFELTARKPRHSYYIKGIKYLKKRSIQNLRRVWPLFARLLLNGNTKTDIYVTSVWLFDAWRLSYYADTNPAQSLSRSTKLTTLTKLFLPRGRNLHQHSHR